MCNGEAVSGAVDGLYVDRCIGARPLPDLQAGDNIIERSLPFDRRTNMEWCYLLGEFGVEVYGEYHCLTAMPDQIGFGNITEQKFPYYTGNVTYCVPFTASGRSMHLQLSHFAGAAVRVALDEEDLGMIAFSPYCLDLGTPDAGEHTLRLTLLGTRENGFGPVHLADSRETWIGQNAWLTERNAGLILIG